MLFTVSRGGPVDIMQDSCAAVSGSIPNCVLVPSLSFLHNWVNQNSRKLGVFDRKFEKANPCFTAILTNSRENKIMMLK